MTSVVLVAVATLYQPVAGHATAGPPPPGTITTFAGSTNDGRQATDTALGGVRGLAADAVGNVFFSEGYAYVRRVSVAGVLSTVVGNGVNRHRGDGGPAAMAEVFNPSGVAVDTAGNVFVAEELGRVRKVSTSGVITTAAGNGSPGFSGDGGLATGASMYAPSDVATDAAGDLFIADPTNGRLRTVAVDGVISTLAGNGGSGSMDDGSVASSGPLPVRVIAADAAGNVYISDDIRGTVRKVTTDGIIHTFAGNGRWGFSGDGGPAVEASLNSPRALAVDATGNLFIADSSNNRIRKVDTSGIITTIAGNGSPASTGDGGPATVAGLNLPMHLAVDAVGDIFVDDLSGHIRRVDKSGTITNFAGGGTYGFRGDGGPAAKAELMSPSAITTDGAGDVFIADSGNGRVRRVTPDGTINTYAGTGVPGFSGDGGPAVDAQLSGVSGLAADDRGNLYVSDPGNSRIRKVSPDGIITTVAGTGKVGFGGDGGLATAATFIEPGALALDPTGILYVSDPRNQRVRKISADGVITTAAGSGAQGFVTEGVTALNATFQYPGGIATDSHGNLFIADTGNRRVRKLSPDGIVTTVAGSGGQDPRNGQNDGGPPPGDGGLATLAPLDDGVNGVVVDPAGSLFLSESWGATVRKVSPTGIISTVVGSGFTGFFGDGGPATSAQMFSPVAVALDGAGDLFVTEGGNQYVGGNRVRKVTGLAAKQGSVVNSPTPSGLYHPLTPVRILDTRNGTGGFAAPVGANASIALGVVGVGGVPATGVSAVVLNVTVTSPSSAGHLTVFPSGTVRPLASNLNFGPGQAVPNLVMAKVGTDGKVAFYNSVGLTPVIADVVGWYGAAGAPVGSRFNALSPTRILDTRDGTGGFSTPVGSASSIAVGVTGVGGVPGIGVSAVVLNVTATQPSVGGFLTVFPSGSARPLTSNLNVVAGQTVPNLVVAKIGTDGKVGIYNSAGSTHVIFDVVGWFGSDGAASGLAFNPLPPARILDSRNGTGGLNAPLGPASTVAAAVTGLGGVPAVGVSAVVLNVTVTQPSVGGFVTIFPSGATRPLASNLNAVAGQTVPNLVVAKVGPDGKVSIYNASGTTHVVVDVVGWYGP